MPLPVLALHPSPVSLVPRRGRTPRHGWEPVRTPAGLSEADPAAFSPMPTASLRSYGGIREDLFLHDGATWAILGDPAPGGTVPFARGDILAFLRDGAHADPATHEALERALRGTPLVPLSIAPTRRYEARTVPPEEGSWPLAPGNGDRILAEERGRSAASLRSWLDGNLRLAGDRAMIRRPLLVEVTTYSARTDYVLDTGFSLAPYSRIPTRPDRARAVAGRIRHAHEVGAEENLAEIEAFAEGLSRDDDVLLLANRLPALVDADARAGDGTGGRRRPPADPARAGAILERLRPWVLRGCVFGVGPEEAAGVLEFCVSAIADLREAGVPLSASFGDLVAQVEAEFLPRVAGIAPEDEAALALAVR